MEIKRFVGLNNVSDPMRLGLGTLVKADNINITDTGAIVKRDGYALTRAGSFSAMYSSIDYRRAYVVQDNALKTIDGLTIATLASTAPMHWCEVNTYVLFSNGTDAGIIQADNTVLPWRWAVPDQPALTPVTGSLPAGMYMVSCTGTLPDGRETGATEPVYITLAEGQALQISWLTLGCNVYVAPANSEVFQLLGKATQTAMTFNTSPDALGRDLLNAFLDPLPPSTDVIQVWRGRAYAAQYMATENQTVVWFSEALGYHLFNLNSNFIIVPGRVLMLAPHDGALIIGTDDHIYAYTGEKLEQLADYGVVPGDSWGMDGDRLLMWTTRGLCSALPFTNLTERQISVAPGVRAGGCLVQSGGQKRFLAVLQLGIEPAFDAL